jgi:hypothetical protein
MSWPWVRGLSARCPKWRKSSQKARIQTVISGWRPFDTTTIAARYNVGDDKYAQKLDYVLSLFKELKRS